MLEKNTSAVAKESCCKRVFVAILNNCRKELAFCFHHSVASKLEAVPEACAKYARSSHLSPSTGCKGLKNGMQQTAHPLQLHLAAFCTFLSTKDLSTFESCQGSLQVASANTKGKVARNFSHKSPIGYYVHWLLVSQTHLCLATALILVVWAVPTEVEIFQLHTLQ